MAEKRPARGKTAGDDRNLVENEASEGSLDLESWVRVDMAQDINSPTDPSIRPGDSIVVSCDSPVGGGIAEDAFGPRVYMYVRTR